MKLLSYIAYFNKMIQEETKSNKIEPISSILERKSQLEIAYRIQEEIKAQRYSGVSQNEISKISGISLPKIKKYSSGCFNDKVKEDDLMAFAEAFDCSVYYLLGETPNRSGIHEVTEYGAVDKEFCAVFDETYVELEELVQFLLNEKSDCILRILFVITYIMDEKDADLFIKLIKNISEFIDIPREYIHPDLPEDDPQKRVKEYNFRDK